MKKLLLSALLVSFVAMFTNDVKAYTNEVRASGSSYIWRTDNVDRGTVSDLATAINNTLAANREIHVLVGGYLSATIGRLPINVKMYFHGNTFTTTHSGIAVHAKNVSGVKVYDMKLNAPNNFYVFRFSGVSNAVLSGISINGGGIGMRIESSDAKDPWNFTFTDLTVQNCTYENTSSHGLETYSVDRFNITGIVARNTGECGVCLNSSRNGTVGTVDAYRCCKGGGYAGLRLCNTCYNVTSSYLKATECGRGYFVLSGSYNCHLNNCEIYNCSDVGIWLENVTNCTVKAGCVVGNFTRISGSGSYANVSTSCGINGVYKLQNRGTGLVLDGYGRTANGSVCAQYSNGTTHPNAKWEVIALGSYYQIKNVGTGLVLDGYGRTANGSDLAMYSSSTTHVNSQWTFENYDGNYYRIKNRGTGLYIDGMGRTANGDACGQYANTTHVNAQWILVPTTKSALLDENQNLSDGAEDLNGIEIYPNPVQNELNINWSSDKKQNTQVSIFNGTGKCVIEKADISGSVDVSQLNSGVYIIKVTCGNEIVVRKFIKE
ncbi:MAG: RICIN domain-containing protein [Marinilabiliaceae bacterium]|nr:RICIN domain-containing protein [Marinilabiliaceae bacterium]